MSGRRRQLVDVLNALNSAHRCVTEDYDDTLGDLLDRIDDAIEATLDARQAIQPAQPRT